MMENLLFFFSVQIFKKPEFTSLLWFVDITLGPQMFKNVTDFSTFLLDRSSGVLYLGAKDAILAVDTNNLNQQPRKVGR